MEYIFTPLLVQTKGSFIGTKNRVYIYSITGSDERIFHWNQEWSIYLLHYWFRRKDLSLVSRMEYIFTPLLVQTKGSLIGIKNGVYIYSITGSDERIFHWNQEQSIYLLHYWFRRKDLSLESRMEYIFTPLLVQTKGSFIGIKNGVYIYSITGSDERIFHWNQEWSIYLLHHWFRRKDLSLEPRMEYIFTPLLVQTKGSFIGIKNGVYIYSINGSDEKIFHWNQEWSIYLLHYWFRRKDLSLESRMEYIFTPSLVQTKGSFIGIKNGVYIYSITGSDERIFHWNQEWSIYLLHYWFRRKDLSLESRMEYIFTPSMVQTKRSFIGTKNGVYIYSITGSDERIFHWNQEWSIYLLHSWFRRKDLSLESRMEYIFTPLLVQTKGSFIGIKNGVYIYSITGSDERIINWNQEWSIYLLHYWFRRKDLSLVPRTEYIFTPLLVETKGSFIGIKNGVYIYSITGSDERIFHWYQEWSIYLLHYWFRRKDH